MAGFEKYGMQGRTRRDGTKIGLVEVVQTKSVRKNEGYPKPYKVNENFIWPTASSKETRSKGDIIALVISAPLNGSPPQ